MKYTKGMVQRDTDRDQHHWHAMILRACRSPQILRTNCTEQALDSFHPVRPVASRTSCGASIA